MITLGLTYACVHWEKKEKVYVIRVFKELEKRSYSLFTIAGEINGSRVRNNFAEIDC